MAHRRYEEADFSEDCSDGETLGSSEEDEYDSAEDSAAPSLMKMNPLSDLRLRKTKVVSIILLMMILLLHFFFPSILQCVKKLEHLNLKWE
jgi:hypothetical protein